MMGGTGFSLPEIDRIIVEAEIEEWSRPEPRPDAAPREYGQPKDPVAPRRSRARLVLPKSLIEWPTEQESGHVERRSA